VHRNRKREEWLRDVDARQRNVVFPNTVENETRFWRNLGQQPFTINTKVGLALLALLGWGFLIRIVVALFKEKLAWAVILAMLLLWGPFFGVIAWATRRALRNIQNARRKR
jgi:hypothetical protein